MQTYSSNEDTRKRLRQHVESLRSVAECIDSREDKRVPDLKMILGRFTAYAR